MKYFKLFFLGICISFWIACGKDDDMQTTDEVTANFTVPTGTLFTDTDILFTNTSSNATEYEWDFGDGSNSTLKNPTHNYDIPGPYVVQLTSSSSNMDEHTKTLTINIVEKPAPITITDCGQFGNVTWTDHNPDGVDYIIDCDRYQIQAGILTIEPGTHVALGEREKIFINDDAGLIANEVIFTGLTSDMSWGGLVVKSGNLDLTDCQLINSGSSATSVSGAGNVNSSIIIDGTQDEPGTLRFEDLMIDGSSGYGIYMSPHAEVSNFLHNGIYTISNSPNFAISCEIDALSTFGKIESTITDCFKEDRIEVRASETKVAFQQLGRSFPAKKVYVSGDILFRELNIFRHSIKAGADIMMGKDASIIVQDSAIEIKGTSDNKIKIYGEDRTKGYWRHIRFDRSAGNNNVIEHLEISDGGAKLYPTSDGLKGGNIVLTQSSNIDILNSTITNSDDCGVLTLNSTYNQLNNNIGNNSGDRFCEY